MNKLGVTILIILVVGIVAATFLYSMTRTVANANDSSLKINYQTVGTVKIYNTSALIPFLSEYVSNISYVKLASQVVQYGILNLIKINNTKGVIGYFKGGVLSSFAFTQLNQTLTSHGFKYAEYQSLLYDYNTTTAIGFDGKYFYVVHDNSTNQTLTTDLLYYIYTSNKTFSLTTQNNMIASGTFEKGNFTAYSNNSQIVVQAYFQGNYTNLTKVLKFFTFTTSNFSATGNIVFKNATVEVYSLNTTYNGKTLYVVTGFKEVQSNMVYGVGIISSQEIGLSEVLSLL